MKSINDVDAEFAEGVEESITRLEDQAKEMGIDLDHDELIIESDGRIGFNMIILIHVMLQEYAKKVVLSDVAKDMVKKGAIKASKSVGTSVALSSVGVPPPFLAMLSLIKVGNITANAGDLYKMYRETNKMIKEHLEGEEMLWDEKGYYWINIDEMDRIAGLFDPGSLMREHCENQSCQNIRMM